MHQSPALASLRLPAADAALAAAQVTPASDWQHLGLRLWDRRLADGNLFSVIFRAADGIDIDMAYISGPGIDSFMQDRKAHVAATGYRGAPMGWSNTPKEQQPLPCRISLRRVRLDSGGYDRDGYYYGLGEPLWQATPYVHGAEPFRFRAPCVKDAKAIVRRSYTFARFYR